MRTLFIIPLVLISLVSFPSWGADFNKGLTAAHNGDFATALKEWKPLAEQGDAEAQVNLGLMYDNGWGVPQDYKEAVQWYRLAAEQGLAVAQVNLGLMYDNGDGVIQDYKEAVRWFRLAAEQGLANAQYNLGWKYEKGRGVPKDKKEAVKWFKLSAEQGNDYAIDRLAELNISLDDNRDKAVVTSKSDSSSPNSPEYNKGVTAYNNGYYTNAFKLLKPLAQDGNADAQYNLGYMYEFGRGVPKDKKEAVNWYRRAAERGHIKAQHNLGDAHLKAGSSDLYFSKDLPEAVRWYRLAADQGFSESQHTLGFMYQIGKGVPKDEKEAVKWYRLAAEQGYDPAQHALGVMYEHGRGVLKDYEEAMRWYKRAEEQEHHHLETQSGISINEDLDRGIIAFDEGDSATAFKELEPHAEKGNARAQFILGIMYERQGYTVPKYYEEAVKWYRLAADQGHTEAQYYLAFMYEKGRGVPRDKKEAVKWYKLSAEQGNDYAIDRLAELGVLIDQEKDKEVISSKSDSSSEALDALRTKAEREERKRKELEQQLASLKEQQSESKTVIKTEPKTSFPNQPIDVRFTAVPKRQDDIAVIIGNANYEKQGKDIPNVNPAYADAEGIKRYFMQAKGVREGNIIYLRDATGSQLASVFGNQNTHKGQLYNWVKKTSNVYIYYAGHGVPGGDKGNAYLVPTDANAQTIDLSGYPLETLYSNLGKLPVKSITVILEACFSGASQAGNLFSKSSPIVIRPTKTMIPENVKVISAGTVDQMASWERDNSHGLFTKYFLKAMSGEGDKNNDGEVSDTELKNYLGETVTYFARRYYGRDQTVQIMQGN